MSPVAYRPSIVASLRLRFDEAFTLDAKLAPPTSSESRGERTGRPALAGVSRAPLVLSQGRDGYSPLTYRIPRAAQIELPGFRQAGKFTLTIPFVQMPIDVRMFRAIGVEVHQGCVSADDFGRGVTGQDTRAAVVRPSRDNLVITGIVDDAKHRMTAEGAEVVLEGRDLRGVLIDTQINPKTMRKVDLRQPIDLVVVDILSLHPHGDRIAVESSPDEWERSLLPSPGAQGNLTRLRTGAEGKAPQLTPPGGTEAASGGTGGGLSYWDLITRYCMLVGAIPYFDREVLRIRPARSIYDTLRKAGLSRAYPLPFAGNVPRTVETGGVLEELRVRRLAIGGSLLELEVGRRYIGYKPQVIEVVALDTDSDKRGLGKLLIAQWPPKPRSAKTAAANVTGVSPSGETSSKDVLRIPVHGIRSKQELERIARDLFEEIARHEVTAHFQTKDLASYGGDDLDPDMLTLRPGDPIELAILTRAGAAETLAQQNARRPFAELVRDLERSLGDANLARAVAATARNAVFELTDLYYTQTVRYDWQDGKVTITGDAQNYVEARNAIDSATQATSAVSRKAAAKLATGEPGRPEEPLVESGRQGNVTYTTRRASDGTLRTVAVVEEE